MDTDHPGPQERLGVEDAPIDMGFGREVDDRVGVRDERAHGARLSDVALDEPEPHGLVRVGLDRREVRAVARVGQLVEDRDARAVGAGEDIANIGAADEPGPAGDEDPGAGGDEQRGVVAGHGR